MKPFKEWRAVGIDIKGDTECRTEGEWAASKDSARADAVCHRGNAVPFDRVIIERRKIGRVREVKA